MNPNEEESVRGQGHDEDLPAPTEDIPSTRLWLAPKDLSAFSRGEIALLHNMGVLSMQLSEITEIIENMAVGPKSRRSSAASNRRSSMKSAAADDNEEQANQGEGPDDGLAKLVADDGIYEQFCNFVSENQKDQPISMVKAKRFRDSVDDKRISNLDDEGLIELCIQLTQRFRANQPSTS
ncbi:hypothetical protein FDECE_1501 [Fusarium decemcellulare]|nr:hypothetical protein FDECE_1501 [Fusarium decemcellulare]